MKFIKSNDDKNQYLFECEVCAKRSELSLPAKRICKFSCPRCNTIYLQWDEPRRGLPDLVHVVAYISEGES